MRVKTDLNADKISADSVFATTFLAEDYYATKATVATESDMKADDSYLQEETAKNWIPIGAKSSKACTKTGGSAALQLVDCSLVNLHY